MTITTCFKSLTDTKTPYYRDVNVIFDLVRTGGKHGDIVDKIRTTKDKEERERLKRSLPITLFSGKFKSRKTEGLEEYNKLVCLDLDNLKNVDVRRFELEQLPFVYAVWLSPSGNGLKVLIKVLTDNHLGHFLALSKEIKGVDPSGKDICRATFLSKDEKIYVNPKSAIYDKVLIPSFTDEQKYDNLKKWLDGKGAKFIDGQRNTFITKLAGAANRFGVSQDFLKGKLEVEFLEGSDFSKREMELTVEGIYERYRDQFNSVVAEEIWTDAKIDEVLSTEVKVNDIIMAKDVAKDLNDDYDNGTKKGDTTYFPEFDNHFRWYNGEVTTMTGISNAGKTQMLTQMLIFRAAFEGKKTAFVSMEQYPPVFFYKEIIRTVVGKPLEQGDPNRMTKAEYNRALEWVNDKFFFLYPEKDEPSVEWLLARFAETLIKHGIHNAVVDPMNSLSHDYKGPTGRDDRYISAMLNKYQRFALQSGIPFVLVAHPRGIGKKEDGTYKEPTADEISGGVSFWQRSDNILCFHRPTLPLDFKDPSCTLRSLKIKKQIINGIPGVSNFTYDRRTGRYFEDGKFNPLTKFIL